MSSPESSPHRRRPSVRRLRHTLLLVAAGGLSAVLAASSLQASAAPPDHSPDPRAKDAGVTSKGGGYAGWAMRSKNKKQRKVAPRAQQKTPGVTGIDVASYQKNVDWKDWWSKGKRFAYVKATEGTSSGNSYFNQQYTGAAKVGMVRGGYHFARPDNSSGKAQANYFAKHGGGWSADGKTLPGMLDIEDNYTNGDRCYGKTPAQLTSWVKNFVTKYRAKTSQDAVIYTNKSFWKSCLANTTKFKATNALDLAQWTTNPPTKLPGGWRNYTFWQYSGSGTDLDTFNGSKAQLKTFATGQAGNKSAGRGAPTASSRTTKRLAMFARGDNRALKQKSYKKGTGWGKWKSHGGKLSSAPTAGSRSAKHLAVFVRGRNHALKQKSYKQGSGWGKWKSHGGKLTSAPTAGSRSAKHLAVLVRGHDHKLKQKSYKQGSGWGKWKSHGGKLTSAPTAGSRSAKRLTVFVRGHDHKLKRKSYKQGSGWGKWKSHGGKLTSAPTAASRTPKRLTVFVRGHDHKLKRKSYKQGSGWGKWKSHGGKLTSAPTAVSRGKHHLTVLVRGHDHTMKQKTYRSGHGWGKWKPVPRR